nr:hypothetical protein [Tanacetum cinerariifolium]
MDAYRDKGMGEVIVGKPFLKEIRIKARRFEGRLPFTMVVPNVEEVSLVDGVFDGAFSGEGEEEVVMREGLEEEA